MNIQEVYAKVSSSVGSQTKSVNFAMHKLDKDQSANCSVHTRLILDSQDSSSSKTIASPLVLETTFSPSILKTTAPPSVSKTIDPPSSQYQSVNTAASVKEISNQSWFVNLSDKN